MPHMIEVGSIYHACAKMRPMVDNPIRIIHVMNALAVAGMEVGVIKLVNRQDPKTFRSILCCLQVAMEDALPLVNPDTPVVVLGKKRGIDFTLFTKLVALFRKERPHIVHSHNWATLLYVVVAAKIARVPVIIHGEHGYEEQAAIERRLGSKRLLARHVSRLTTVSSNIERILIEQWRVPPERVTYIPNGIDLNRFPPGLNPEPLRREFGFTSEHRVITSIGRFVPVKDFPLLIRSFASVHRRHPEARLLLIGAGHPTALRLLAESLGVGSAVLLPGTRGDVPNLLNLTDIYVNSSSFEGMSNTILEAMASSRPVVATDVGGNHELVREGETGFLVPSGDEAALANRLTRLLDDATLRAAMGADARKVASRDHPIARTVDRYNAMYVECMIRGQLQASQPSGQAVRRAAARALRYSGLTWIRGATERNVLTILAYHRVLPLQESLLYPFQSRVILGRAAPSWLKEKLRLLEAGEPAGRVGESLVRVMNRITLEERDEAMDVLRRATGDGNGYVDPPVLSWDEVGEMRRAGMLIGAHTVSHPFLDELSPDAARHEIDQSIQTLRRHLDEPIPLFSYPRGRYKEDVKPYLKEFGIEAAVTTELGRNSPGADPYALRRFDAGYCRIHAGHDTVLLDVEIQGWFHPLRAGYIPS